MDKAGSERRLTGRAASIAKRRALAAGGKATHTSAEIDPPARRPEPTPAPTRPEAPIDAFAPTYAPSRREPRRARQPEVSQGRAQSIQRRERLTRGGNPSSQAPARRELDARTQGLSGREAAIARRRAIAGVADAEPQVRSGSSEHSAPPPSESRSRAGSRKFTPRSVTDERRARASRPRNPNDKKVAPTRGRLLSMARRAAMADRGKSGVDALSGHSRNAATTSLMRNAGVSSREIAKRVREERCAHGKCGDLGPRPSGRTRSNARAGAPPKVEVSETASGQTLTGTRVGRSARTTGDESGACRAVTGTEYMGAELFQEFCGIDPSPAPGRQSAMTLTEHGQPLTGVQVGRSDKVTGDETGAGRQLTGTPYTAPGPEGAPPKVRASQTFSGGTLTGSMVGRSERMTGDEPGTCQRVTGDEYLSFEHFTGHCKSEPEPFGNKKVGFDATWRGQSVTGSQVGRSHRVTGDEPGSCEIITGTAYLGTGPFGQHCGPAATQAAAARVQAIRGTPGAGLTGRQPGINGAMTGGAKGVCQSVTGTPYLGGDQFFAACGQGAEATPGSADFPQPLAGGNWDAFSVGTPARTAQAADRSNQSGRGVTGTRYDEAKSRITGPFNMASGVVTGTQDFRLQRPGSAGQRGGANPAPMAMSMALATPATEAETPAETDTEPHSRITGEGLDGGTRITGNDWGRNERVTGTEGTSALSRNPTRRGTPAKPFAGARAYRDAQERQAPEQHITGGGGNTERGALVTLSGGARG